MITKEDIAKCYDREYIALVIQETGELLEQLLKERDEALEVAKNWVHFFCKECDDRCDHGMNPPKSVQDSGKNTDLLQLVMDRMKWEKKKAQLWFTTQNPLLGGATPNGYEIMRGKARLEKFIRAQLLQNGTDNGVPHV